MEPGVPFALLGTVELLTAAAWVVLAVAALGLSRRDGSGSAAVALVLGSLLLAGVATGTGLLVGTASSDLLSLLRALGLALVAAGLYAGALAGRPYRPGPVAAGVVVPLAAGLVPSLLGGAAGLAAAVASLRARRDAVGSALAVGLALSGAASYLARSGTSAPVGVLLLQGAGSLALLAGMALLTRTSLLAEVVAAILAGVLVMAVAAVGVVGTVVVTQYDRENRDLVRQAAQGRAQGLQDVAQQASLVAGVAPAGCKDPPTCAAVLRLFGQRGADFLARVPQSGEPQSLAGRPALTRSELLGLRGARLVQDVLGGQGADALRAQQGIVQLTGPDTAVAELAVVPGSPPVGLAKPAEVLVYGIRVDDRYAQGVSDLGGFGFAVLAGSPLRIVASNGSADQRRQLLTVLRTAHVAQGFPGSEVTLANQGRLPTVQLRKLTDGEGTVAVLAVTRSAATTLAAERAALQSLLVTALLATAVVSGLAVLLGRPTVEPVRRLTAAAQRVSSGDLTGSAGVTTRDEVGVLSSTFDAMTGNLARLTGDLRSSAVRLETVLASMSDGLLATDARGRVTSVNPAALAMLGRSREGVLGRPLEEVADVRDIDGTQLADPGLRLLDEAAEVCRPDGTTVPVRVALTALADGDGAVLVLRDTSREGEVERMKTEFLSNVSHELRTPLTPIRGYAEILLAKPALAPEQVTTFASTIRHESLRMGRVVDLLVDVAALEAGRVSVVPRTTSAAELLGDRLTAWRTRAPDRAADLSTRVGTSLPPVYVDPSWVGKALDEFIDNALKYAPPGGPVTLIASWSPDRTRVRVAVRDCGPGIAAADRATLFTSFEQVDGSATRRVGGLGLGLSFVRRLAEDAGFPLTVRSTVGRGSEFALDLPLARAGPPRLPRRTRPTGS